MQDGIHFHQVIFRQPVIHFINQFLIIYYFENKYIGQVYWSGHFMKSFLKTLIIITGLYVITNILFDLNFNPEIHLVTKIIEALFFLLLLIYVVFLNNS